MDEFCEKIVEKAKDLKMKTKAHFLLRSILSIISIVVFLILALFVISYIGFVLRINAFAYLFKLGWLGIGSFFLGFPWLLILLSLGFVILLYYSSKRFSLVYKKPVIYSFVVIMILVMVSGFVISKTGFHSKVPVMGSLYQSKRVNKGVVLDVRGREVILKDFRGKQHKAIIASSTKRAKFDKGDMIMIVGRKKDGVIQARGIVRIPPKRMK